MPSGMTRDQIIKRYDDNCGFPTDKMVAEMKAACAKIGNMKTYDDWFKVRSGFFLNHIPNQYSKADVPNLCTHSA